MESYKEKKKEYNLGQKLDEVLNNIHKLVFWQGFETQGKKEEGKMSMCANQEGSVEE